MFDVTLSRHCHLPRFIRHLRSFIKRSLTSRNRAKVEQHRRSFESWVPEDLICWNLAGYDLGGSKCNLSQICPYLLYITFRYLLVSVQIIPYYTPLKYPRWIWVQDMNSSGSVDDRSCADLNRPQLVWADSGLFQSHSSSIGFLKHSAVISTVLSSLGQCRFSLGLINDTYLTIIHRYCMISTDCSCDM